MSSEHKGTPLAQTQPVGRAPFVLFATGAVLFMLEGLRTKIVPGGPFISVLGEALPILLFAASIVLSVCALRRASAYMKFMLWCMCLHSAAAIGILVDGIIRFWFRPYARGDLFGQESGVSLSGLTSFAFFSAY